ncbi:hypothetical protein BX666DRAFT_2027265 [Dichotomocladium elegans]|nr:hypothetical protein BX666DRAFT_2027265 [Dichotomocladium elegans]
MGFGWDRGLAAPAQISHQGFIEVLLPSSASSVVSPDASAVVIVVGSSSSLLVPSSNPSAVASAVDAQQLRFLHFLSLFGHCYRNDTSRYLQLAPWQF